MSNKAKGTQGETDAEAYLVGNGYAILERNFACAVGEIDLIAQKDGRYVFVEVKSRTQNRFGTPAQAVNRTKQQHIVKAALFYLKTTVRSTDVPMRFDVIEVLPGQIRHIPSAFAPGGYY